MSRTQPIRQADELNRFKDYYLKEHPNPRNYALIVLGLNTALRIGDILKITWGMVYDFENRHYHAHLHLTEQKTRKETIIALNQAVIAALENLRQADSPSHKDDYLFNSQKNHDAPISRYQAFRIIKKAADELHIEGIISCHSLLKTFGYHAWKKGTPPAVIMTIYNHSSLDITKRYLSIDQDDKDKVFLEINL